MYTSNWLLLFQSYNLGEQETGKGGLASKKGVDVYRQEALKEFQEFRTERDHYRSWRKQQCPGGIDLEDWVDLAPAAGAWFCSGREYIPFQGMDLFKPIMKILVLSFSASLTLRSGSPCWEQEGEKVSRILQRLLYAPWRMTDLPSHVTEQISVIDYKWKGWTPDGWDSGRRSEW